MTVLDLFQRGDVHLDYRFEDMKFRFQKSTGQVFARYNGRPEVEVPQSSRLFNEAISVAKVITREEYFADEAP